MPKCEVFAPANRKPRRLPGAPTPKANLSFEADRDGFWSAEAHSADQVARSMIRVGGDGAAAEPLFPVSVIGVLAILLAGRDLVPAAAGPRPPTIPGMFMAVDLLALMAMLAGIGASRRRRPRAGARGRRFGERDGGFLCAAARRHCARLREPAPRRCDLGRSRRHRGAGARMVRSRPDRGHRRVDAGRGRDSAAAFAARRPRDQAQFRTGLPRSVRRCSPPPSHSTICPSRRGGGSSTSPATAWPISACRRARRATASSRRGSRSMGWRSSPRSRGWRRITAAT